MQTPFDSEHDRAIFEYCARAHYLGDPRSGEACFTFNMLTQEMRQAKFLARFTLCRIAYMLHGMALIVMLPILWSALAISRGASRAFPRISFAHQGAERLRSLIEASRQLLDDLLFCFDALSYARFCYLRLSCFWIRSVCAGALPTRPGFAPPIAVSGDAPTHLSNELLRYIDGGHLGARRWASALWSADMFADDFALVDAYWARSGLSMDWKPYATLPAYGALRLACSGLCDQMGASHAQAALRGRALCARAGQSELSEHLAGELPSSGPKRL